MGAAIHGRSGVARRVETFPSVKLAFNTELAAAEQSANGVIAPVRNVADGERSSSAPNI